MGGGMRTDNEWKMIRHKKKEAKTNVNVGKGMIAEDKIYVMVVRNATSWRSHLTESFRLNNDGIIK